jgi:hypothetical protein
MKLFILAAVITAAAVAPSSAQSADVCNALTTVVPCLQNPACNWCRCKAIPSVCVNASNAVHLPAGVFVCGNQSNPTCGSKTAQSTCELDTGCVWCTEAGGVPSCKPFNATRNPALKCSPPSEQSAVAAEADAVLPTAGSLCGNETIPPVAGRKNVLLIGDSISMAVPYTPGGYGKNVQARRALKEAAAGLLLWR